MFNWFKKKEVKEIKEKEKTLKLSYSEQQFNVGKVKILLEFEHGAIIEIPVIGYVNQQSGYKIHEYNINTPYQSHDYWINTPYADTPYIRDAMFRAQQQITSFPEYSTWKSSDDSKESVSGKVIKATILGEQEDYFVNYNVATVVEE
jgi:hypothetical protein